MNNILILCGGKGTRLKNITTNPKCLINLNNDITFLEYFISQINKSIKCRIYLAIGYKSNIIKDFIKQKDINVDIIEEFSPLGTGGAIKNAFEKTGNEYFTIFNGDTLYSSRDIISFMTSKFNKSIKIAGCHINNNTRYGIIKNSNYLMIVRDNSMETKDLVYGGFSRVHKDIFLSYQKKSFGFEECINNSKISEASYDIHEMADQFLDYGTEGSYKKIIELFNK
tara:strand:- start:10482 stop:11156 length:675 start_codon:yes stop_codon:yes gene_type:complete